MTQPKPQTSTVSNPYKKSTSHILLKIIVLAALVAIAVIAYLVYHNHQLKEQAYQADKARFAQIESDMKAAYSAMTAAAGVPDVSKQTKTCSNVSLKYAKGQLNCGTTYEFAYVSQSYKDFASLTNLIQSAVTSTGILALKPGAINANGINPNSNTMPDIDIMFDHKNGFDCSLYASFTDPAMHEDFSTIKDSHITRYIFGCSRDVNATVYEHSE